MQQAYGIPPNEPRNMSSYEQFLIQRQQQQQQQSNPQQQLQPSKVTYSHFFLIFFL
jgi:hypothetical protein